MSPGQSSGRTRREYDAPTRGQQILSDLTTGLSAAHNENTARGQGTSSAVVRGVLLSDPVRKGVGHRRHPRDVLVAGRHYDSARLENLVAGL